MYELLLVLINISTEGERERERRERYPSEGTTVFNKNMFQY
jgi:hypothetical protein